MADKAVQAEGDVAKAVEFLLARTAIVKDMDDAVALARRAKYSFRIVTLQGDIVNPGGVMTGGSIQKNSLVCSLEGEILKSWLSFCGKRRGRWPARSRSSRAAGSGQQGLRSEAKSC